MKLLSVNSANNNDNKTSIHPLTVFVWRQEGIQPEKSRAQIINSQIKRSPTRFLA